MADRQFDPRYCEMQDETIKQIVGRVQKLVDEYHEGNVALSDIQGDIKVIQARVPEDLPQQLTILAVKHDGLHRDFTLLRGQVYALIGAFLLSGVGAFVAWVVRGGMK